MNTDSELLLAKILKDHGYSVTKARMAVFCLMENHEPQSMGELTKNSTVLLDRASLYRTIELFERLGIVQRLYIGWKYKLELSDVFSHHHHHLTCLGCGKMVAIKEEAAIEDLLQRIAATHDMTAERHQLEIQGYCAACRLAASLTAEGSSPNPH